MDIKLQNCFLSVDDHDKAIAFYRDAMGFEVRADVGANARRWVTVGPPSQPDVKPAPRLTPQRPIVAITARRKARDGSITQRRTA